MDEVDEPCIEMLGLQFDALPDGWTPVDGIALIKCLDETGNVRWCSTQTDNLIDQEIIGALSVEHEMRKSDLIAVLREDDD